MFTLLQCKSLSSLVEVKNYTIQRVNKLFLSLKLHKFDSIRNNIPSLDVAKVDLVVSELYVPHRYQVATGKSARPTSS